MISRVKIYPYQIGLVFKKGHFLNAILEGTHWFLGGEEVKIYDTTMPFAQPCSLDILLEDAMLQKALKVIEVKDNEIALMYQNGNFHRVLTPGRYAFWNSVVDHEFKFINLNETEIEKDVDKKLLMRPALLRYISVHEVASFEKGLLFIDGELIRELKPGTYYFWKNEKPIQVLNADLRVQQMEISGQEILTKDKAALRVNFFLQYQIVDIEKALLSTKDAAKQLYLLMQMAIREYVGTYSLDDLLAKKEAIIDAVLASTNEKVADLGMKTLACGIRDVILPGEVKEIMNQVLVAEKKAQANTIMRREETASTRSLLNTAKLMEDNAMLMKLKEMEYVEKIADKINGISVSGNGQIVEQLKQIFVG